MTAAVDVDYLSCFVPGHSKTKGSMKLRPNGTAAQSVVGSTAWARLLAHAIGEAWRGRPPMTGPLYYAATYVLAGDPIATRAGDGDKLERNVWDALHACVTPGPKRKGCVIGCKKHAGVVADDVQFVRWCGTKRCSEGVDDPIGVHILVGRESS